MRFRLVPVPGTDHIGCCWRLPLPKDVTTLLPRLTARAYLQTLSAVVWASLEKTSLALCTRTANVCVRVFVSERERDRGRGQAVLSIKMPALYFHTAEQREGPVEEDMTPNRRPDLRARPARINQG